MAEYITREDAINAFDDPRVDRYYGDVSPSSVIDVIKTIPAAAVRENVRGEWVVDEKENPNGVDWCHCSVCGCKDITQNISSINFCPNCGADMRGENDG